MLPAVKASSFRLNSLRPLGLTSTLWPATTFSSISSISATANQAMTTTTKSMPSARCTESKVYRYTPEFEPTQITEFPRPIMEDSTPLTGCLPSRLVRQHKPKTISTQYPDCEPATPQSPH